MTKCTINFIHLIKLTFEFFVFFFIFAKTTVVCDKYNDLLGQKVYDEINKNANLTEEANSCLNDFILLESIADTKSLSTNSFMGKFVEQIKSSFISKQMFFGFNFQRQLIQPFQMKHEI